MTDAQLIKYLFFVLSDTFNTICLYNMYVNSLYQEQILFTLF